MGVVLTMAAAIVKRNEVSERGTAILELSDSFGGGDWTLTSKSLNFAGVEVGSLVRVQADCTMRRYESREYITCDKLDVVALMSPAQIAKLAEQGASKAAG